MHLVLKACTSLGDHTVVFPASLLVMRSITKTATARHIGMERARRGRDSDKDCREYTRKKDSIPWSTPANGNMIVAILPSKIDVLGGRRWNLIVHV